MQFVCQLLALLVALDYVCADESMSYLDNGQVKVGVDLNLGGAITCLARAGGDNMINNFDHGRQVQLSFYSGPVPFSVGDQKPAPHWEHLGWNPIQAGDDFHHGSQVLEHRNDGHTLYVKCVPLQWPLNNVPGECTFESWLELDGITVKARARLNNARTDRTQYAARLQELPAVYANAPYHRVVSYQGEKPFTNDAVAVAPKPKGKHPWSMWHGTEQWSALLDDHDQGLGLITPGRVWFTGGFAGKPGPNNEHATHTGYVAGQGMEILDANIGYEFRYELVVGSLNEIRERAKALHTSALPSWSFEQDRQGWHYNNASDTGWPVQGALDIKLDQNDPQLMGPATFWRAEDAPFLIIEAAFKTKQTNATIFWQGFGEDTPKHGMNVAIQSDEAFHRYVVKLSDSAEYRGGMLRLRFDPVGSGSPGEWCKVKSIRLAPAP